MNKSALRRRVSRRIFTTLPHFTFAAATLVFSSQGHAQASAPALSAVTVYGIVDAAVRHTTHDQASASQPNAGKTQMIGGGMSQSRLGFNIVEDLGSGTKAIGGFEHRFLLDTGAQPTGEFWQQSWVGLQTGLGRVTLGRQYNVLFDVYTSTFPSFKYSPYIEAYKPELGFSLGSRVNNSVKYTVQFGGSGGSPALGNLGGGTLNAEMVASAGEGALIGGKSAGGMLRYAVGDLALGGAYMELQDGAGRKSKGSTLGASYASGPWYVSAAFARNSFEAGYNPLLILAMLTSTTTNGFYGPNIDHRDGYSLGATYQLTPQVNLGGHYWHVKQQGVTPAGDGKADFVALVADYAFSKRTDAYVEIDRTGFNGAVTFPNGARTRIGSMIGLRHRF